MPDVGDRRDGCPLQRETKGRRGGRNRNVNRPCSLSLYFLVSATIEAKLP